MANINTEAILNSNPTKKLRIAFEKLKSDYTTENAEAYSELYKNQPLRFIIENSRYIFSEPQYGYNFYKEQVIENPYALLFAEYASEHDKILNYLEESSDKIPDKQKKMYDLLCSVVEEKCIESHSTSIILNHGLSYEPVKSVYDTLIESVYQLSDDSKIEETNETIRNIIESVDNADLFFAITPYITALENTESPDYLIMHNITRFITECGVSDNKIIDIDEWQNFIESVVILSKLYQDKIYVEAVNKLHRTSSIVLESIASESIKTQLDELFVEHITESSQFNTYYSTSHRAVNQIFEDDDMYGIMAEENAALKENHIKLNELAHTIMEEYVTYEYMNSDETSEIKGYNFFESGTTVEDALKMFIEAKKESTVSTAGNPSPTVAIHAGTTKNPSDKKGKGILPNVKSLADNHMIKNMDKEARRVGNSEVKQTMDSVKGAVKSTAAAPVGVVNDIKNGIREWDNWDDERRRKYIIEPGYRKRIIKRFKLALLYGGTAMANMALLPVVFMARHYSKIKDRRIRNDLARELDTEVKVCEEKISDAAANGDLKEKYKLMRIKSQLERESLRVKSNSKVL